MPRARPDRRGFTLVECMLAGALLALASLALFEGVGLSARIARENSQVLAADALAWDAVWKKFNEDYDMMRSQTDERLTEEAAPELHQAGSEAVLRVTVVPVTVESGGVTVHLKSIEADVEWGAPGKRMRLSDWHRVFTYRSGLGRVPWQ